MNLYDVYNMVNNNLPLDRELLRKIILFYLAVGGSHEPKVSYRLEHIDDIQFKHIRATLIPVLKKTENFDFNTAKATVKNFILELLSFSEDEKRFVEEFNGRNYCPSLLFSDEEIVNRISHHPMAIWKCK